MRFFCDIKDWSKPINRVTLNTSEICCSLKIDTNSLFVDQTDPTLSQNFNISQYCFISENSEL